MSVFRIVVPGIGVLALLLSTLPQLRAEPARSITLAQALARVSAANPRLAVADREIGAATGRRIQSGAIPNPDISATVENVYGTGPYRGLGAAETTLQLGQLIEFPGKRDARITAATAELDAARWQRQAERLEVLSETAVLFATILGSQRRIQIFDGLVNALDGMQPLLQRRVDSGASSPVDIGRAQVAADLIRAEKERAQVALDIARRELAVLMGKSAPDFGPAVGDFGAIGTPPAFATLVRALNDHPQLSRWTAVRAQRKAEVLSARLKPAPDVRLGVGYRHFRETRDNAMTFDVAAVIPLWDQNQGAIMAAQETLAKTEAERSVNKSALTVLLGRAYETARGAQRELNLLQSSTIPKAREAIRAVEEGYAQGRFSLIELLDTQAAFAQAMQREADALVSFHAAIATLEWLTGAPVSLSRARPR
ncbi:MAG: TolC family protein [Xanthobacteraceae bacterium]|nr:TolC family protein [Xanthobacteraceae bacterium]